MPPPPPPNPELPVWLVEVRVDVLLEPVPLPVNPERPDKPDSPERLDRLESELPDNPESPDKPDRPDNPERPERPDIPDPPVLPVLPPPRDDWARAVTGEPARQHSTRSETRRLNMADLLDLQTAGIQCVSLSPDSREHHRILLDSTRNSSLPTAFFPQNLKLQPENNSEFTAPDTPQLPIFSSGRVVERDAF
jgi:hypothetical protein